MKEKSQINTNHFNQMFESKHSIRQTTCLGLKCLAEPANNTSFCDLGVCQKTSHNLYHSNSQVMQSAPSANIFKADNPFRHTFQNSRNTVPNKYAISIQPQ